MTIEIDHSTRSDLTLEEKKRNRYVLAIWLAEVAWEMGRPSWVPTRSTVFESKIVEDDDDG